VTEPLDPCLRGSRDVEDAADAEAADEAAGSVNYDAPTRAEVAAAVADIEAYMPQRPPNFENLVAAEAEAWARGAVENWAEQNNIPLSEQQVIDAARGYVEDETGIHVPMDWNTRDAAQAAADAACVAAANYVGVDPRLAVTTVEALADGSLDTGDCEAIGAMAGAVACAAALQAFGIPAPIGAWLGGQFGALIGGTIAAIFGMTAAARRRAEQLRKAAECAAGQEWNLNMVRSCNLAHESYSLRMLYYIQEIESMWSDIEQEQGIQFKLRWFGAAPTGTSQAWRFTHTQEAYDGCWGSWSPGGTPTRSERWCRRPGVACATNYHWSQLHIPGEGELHRQVSSFWCWCENEGGCDYDYSATLRVRSFGPEVPTGETSIYYNRAARSLIMRGAAEPGSQQSCSERLREPTCWFLNGDQYQVCLWRNEVIAAVRREWAELGKLDTIATQVISDLIQTAAIVATENYARQHHEEIRASSTADLIKAAATATVGGRSVFTAREIIMGRQRADIAKHVVLWGGAGVLAYAIWRRLRK